MQGGAPRYFPQGPLAIGSFVFDDGDADRLSRVLHALPYPRSGADARISWFQEDPGVLAVVRDVFPAVSIEQLEIEDVSDRIAIVYEGQAGPDLPSATISVMALGRFSRFPLVAVDWGSEWPPGRKRDIECDDVLSHYLLLAEKSRCRCSVLGIEQSIVQIGNELHFPRTSYACAVTCGAAHARDTDPNYGSVVEMIRRSIGTIGGLPCRVR